MDDQPKLFEIGSRVIVQDALYAFIGEGRIPSDRRMAVAYDSKTNKSTWVSPAGPSFYADGRGLMALVVNNDSLEDAFDTPKPCLLFKGGIIEFDNNYRPTPAQIAILQNWYGELQRAGIGGRGIEPPPLRDSIK